MVSYVLKELTKFEIHVSNEKMAKIYLGIKSFVIVEVKVFLDMVLVGRLLDQVKESIAAPTS